MSMNPIEAAISKVKSDDPTLYKNAMGDLAKHIVAPPYPQRPKDGVLATMSLLVGLYFLFTFAKKVLAIVLGDERTHAGGISLDDIIVYMKKNR